MVEKNCWCQEENELSERPREGGGGGHRAGPTGIGDMA